jgi:hypothetical protein
MRQRPIRIEGDVAYVPLTKGYEAIIDAADVPLVEGFNWCSHVKPRAVYAVRTDFSGPAQRTVRLHRTIMGEPDGFEVDHRDGDGLNNRRTNLRIATSSQNKHNQRLNTRNSSGFKGVSWFTRLRKWQARIAVNGKAVYLGSYRCSTAAHFAYAKASRELHGEYGRFE